MRRNTHNTFTISIFTAICAAIMLLLSIVPLPTNIVFFRPAWLAIFIIYYAIAYPRFAVLGFAWCFGLLLDALYGSTLGMHSLGLVVVAYLSHTFYKQIRVQHSWQQAVWVFLLVLTYQFISLFVKAVINEPFSTISLISIPFCSMLIWPLFSGMLLRAEKLLY